MPGSPKKRDDKPAYERPEGIDDPELEKQLEEDAAAGNDQRAALERLLKKAVRKEPRK